MPTVHDLIEQARRLSPEARWELRDMLDESLAEEKAGTIGPDEGPYSSLLEIAGTARSPFPDVSARKNMHLAQIYAGRRTEPGGAVL